MGSIGRVYKKSPFRGHFFVVKAGDGIVRKDGPDNRGDGNVNEHRLENLKILSVFTFTVFWDMT
jgi:hypothetical protein